MDKLRIWSEKKPYGELEGCVDLLKDYNIVPSIAVPESKLSKFNRLATRMHEKGLESYVWPVLEGCGYWINSSNYNEAVAYLRKLKPVLKAYPEITRVVLDIEPIPLINRLYDSDDARKGLEKATEELQKDCGRDVMTVENFFALNSKVFDSPTPLNAKRKSVMVYTSTLGGRLSRRWRESLLRTALNKGRDLYGNVEVDLGATSEGVMPSVFKVATYQSPEILRQEIKVAKENGASNVGVFSLDGMKKLEYWLRELTKS